MTTDKHYLYLIKDLAYHYAFRNEQFNITKLSNKNFCILNHSNPLVEEVNLISILKNKNIADKFPMKFFDTSNLKSNDLCNIDKPSISYKYTKTIRNTILNYNSVIKESLDHQDMVCQCNTSQYKNSDHGHIVTGNLNFIKNLELRKVFEQGLNFRIPVLRDKTRALKSISEGLTDYIKKTSNRYKVPITAFEEWKNTVIDKVEQHMNHLATGYTSTEKFIRDKSKFDASLNELHNDFVCVPTDKSNNNVTIVCKKLYVSVIEKELGESFESVDVTCTESKIISDQAITIPTNDCNLARFYATCKQHKPPIKFRFTTFLITNIKNSTNFSKRNPIFLYF